MPEQDHFWSRVAASYEREFIDPYRADVRRNPLTRVLKRLRDPEHGVVADFGCGIGPLLPFLSQHFKTVYAVDFAEGMLDRARAKAEDCPNVTFIQSAFTNLQALPAPVDVAVAVNSLVLPNPDDMEQALREIGRCLKPDGYFLGILPAMDAVHYYTMLLVDRQAGKPTSRAALHGIAVATTSLGQFHFRDLVARNAVPGRENETGRKRSRSIRARNAAQRSLRAAAIGLPAMDAVHYYTMLLVDRARAAGKPIAAARLRTLHGIASTNATTSLSASFIFAAWNSISGNRSRSAIAFAAPVSC